MSFLKKMDRALHRKEYQQYKNQLQMHHSSTKQLKDLIDQKEAMYQKHKFSAGAGDLKNELDELYNSYNHHSEMVNHLQKHGLKALKMTPEEIRQKEKENNMLKYGLAGGFVTGSVLAPHLNPFGVTESSGLFESAKLKFGTEKE